MKGNDSYKKLSQRDYSGRDSDTYAQFLQTIFYHIQGNNETDLFFKLIETSIEKNKRIEIKKESRGKEELFIEDLILV